MARSRPSPVQQLVDRSRLGMQDCRFRVVKNLHFRVLKNLFPYQLLESWGRAVLVVVRGQRRLPSSARPYLNAARRRHVVGQPAVRRQEQQALRRAVEPADGHRARGERVAEVAEEAVALLDLGARDELREDAVGLVEQEVRLFLLLLF